MSDEDAKQPQPQSTPPAEPEPPCTSKSLAPDEVVQLLSAPPAADPDSEVRCAFLLIYFARDGADRVAFYPVGAYGSMKEAEEERAQMRMRKTVSDDLYECAIVPLHAWGTPHAGTTARAILVDHMQRARAAAETYHAGVDGVSPEIRTLLDRVTTEAKTRTPGPPPLPAPTNAAPTRQQDDAQATADAQAVAQAAAQIAQYTEAQKAAWAALTPQDKITLRREMLEARRTNNKAKLDAVARKFGNIVIMGNPEPAPPGTAPPA